MTGGQRDSAIGASATGAAGTACVWTTTAAIVSHRVASVVLADVHADGRRCESRAPARAGSNSAPALATVVTAWSAYQAREWTGEQAQGTSHATAARIAVNREAALANRQEQIDVATFIQW